MLEISGLPGYNKQEAYTCRLSERKVYNVS